MGGPVSGLEAGGPRAYLGGRRVLLRLASEASHPGDLNHLYRELSLARSVVPDTRRAWLARSEGIEPPSRSSLAPPPLSSGGLLLLKGSTR